LYIACTQYVEVPRSTALQIAQELLARGYIRSTNSSDEFFYDKSNVMYKANRRGLNVDILWNEPSTTSPTELSIRLLSTIVAIYHEHSKLIMRYGVNALGVITLYPQYKEFRKAVAELQCVNLDLLLDPASQTAFWLNIHNTLSLHTNVENFQQLKAASSSSSRLLLLRKSSYNIGGYFYTMPMIEHGILRAHSNIPDTPILGKVCIERERESVCVCVYPRERLHVSQ
jgi:hypothetical protein